MRESAVRFKQFKQFNRGGSIAVGAGERSLWLMKPGYRLTAQFGNKIRISVLDTFRYRCSSSPGQ
jgi:hypothetical protein